MALFSSTAKAAHRDRCFRRNDDALCVGVPVGLVVTPIETMCRRSSQGAEAIEQFKACLVGSGYLGLAVQIEGAARGADRDAPTTADRAAAKEPGRFG